MYSDTILYMGSRLHRVALVAGMLVSAMNVWTGVPVLGLWVGSRFVRHGDISMLALLIAVATMAAGALALLKLIALLDLRLRHLSGRDRLVSRHLPWLRSMRGERPFAREIGAHLDPLDYVLVVAVVVAAVAFEIWFMFFSTSPIDQRSGRG
jgi:hypothetical protein